MTVTSYARIGSVSNGTLRLEDLIPAYLDAVDDIRRAIQETDPDGAKRLAALHKDVEANMGDEDDEHEGEYFDSEEAQFDADELFDALNNHAPPYCYFGAHEGDGADFGFWPSWDLLNDEDHAKHGGGVLKINAGDGRPDPFPDGVEYVLEVNDHGNASLYDPDGNEVWAIV